MIDVSIQYQRYQWSTNTKPIGNLLLSTTTRAKIANSLSICGVEFLPSCALTPCMTSFSYHISGIIHCRTEEKMIYIYATRDIALVKNHLVRGEVAVSKNPGDAMGILHAISFR